MNTKDCGANVDVIGPRTPAVVVSALALVVAVFALLKALELEFKAKTRE